jgi:hypothetical protein
MGEDTSVGEGAAGVREEGARGGVRRIRGGGKQTVGGEKGDATMEEEDTEVGEGVAANQGGSQRRGRREGREARELRGRVSGQQRGTRHAAAAWRSLL